MPPERLGRHMIVTESPLAASGKWRWSILSKSTDGCLGEVLWYHPWRQYIFEPKWDTVFSADCLQELVKFLERVNGRGND